MIERNADIDRDMLELLDRAVKNLAEQRAMIIKLNVMTEEEVTEFINEAGEKYAKKYEKMNPISIMLEEFAEMIMRHTEEEE